MKQGMGGHHSSTSLKDEWITPLWILRALGEFDLDPCSAIGQPWPTAKRHLTIEDDGLSKVWEGRVWLNPPYGSKMGLWLDRLARHGNGIALLFARTETAFFFRYIWEVASALLFIRGRITFFNVEGNAAEGTAGAPSVLVAYGEENAECLRLSGINGKWIQLRSRG